MKQFFYKELEEDYDERELHEIYWRCCWAWLGLSKLELRMANEQLLSESQILSFLYGIKDLKKRKPLAYVLGYQFFYDSDFKVSKHVLIPRPETEELVDLVLKNVQGKEHVVDVGTGSGCIAISLKKSLPSLKLTAIDKSSEALRLAEENAKNLKLELDFIEDDALAFSLEGKFDVIVSNPPYIPYREKLEMERSVTEHEPGLALFVPNDDPLLFYRSIAEWGLKVLNEGGKLYYEIHESYGEEVLSLLSELGYNNVGLFKDLQGKDRMVQASVS